MFASSRRLIYALSNKIRYNNSKNNDEEKLVVDFTRTKKSPFDIKPETLYNAYLSGGFFLLELKKPGCTAWVEIPEKEYRNYTVEARIRLDSTGVSVSAGIIFRIEDQGSYYTALVSDNGYFRLDVVKNNVPRDLIDWTEIPDFNGNNINLNIITYGSCIILLVNGKWAGEINDDTISGGGLGFVAASHEEDSYETPQPDASDADESTRRARLGYFALDTRIKTVEEQYKKWSCDSNIDAKGRLKLAETFAVMGKSSMALEQLNKAWKRRDETIRPVSVYYTEVRTKRELLLAARMSYNLGQFREAEVYLDEILEQWPSSPEGKSAHTEKMKILNELNKFTELKEFALKHSDIIEKDIDYYTILARCYWELKEYGESAEAWSRAFQINSENGVYAANAANAYEFAEKKDEALKWFLEAGKIFLNQGNGLELEAMMTRLCLLGEESWEARALAGKWAFSIEDYDRSEKEFAAAEKLRRALIPKPKADPAVYYLRGLIFNLKGKNTESIFMLKRAVKLAPDYGLFRFKLAEIKLTCGEYDPAFTNLQFAEEFKLALEHIDNDPDGRMANHAGNLLLNAGDAENAEYFFDKAKKQQEMPYAGDRLV
ncbi:MAG: hypothetical protein LBQ89_00155 [Treponema sp.]|jgi:tetratricopeptide (TPR) repeat protein|nr:hypothetical protein [Treponema sp.]